MELRKDDADDKDFDVISPEVDIEIVDDTPDQDKGRPRRPEGKEPEIPDDDDIANYSEGVQKRIKKLRYEFHEERRAKEEAARQLNEATTFAKRLMDEKKRMEDALRKGEEILVENAKSRVESDLELARKKFKEAYDVGDADAIADAQQRMAELSVQKASAINYRPVYPQEEAKERQPGYEPVVRPPTDPKAVDWARKNNWFGRDQLMTDYAKHIHDRIVVFDRVDPRTEEYWQTLDGEMRKRFPEMFDDSDDYGRSDRQVRQPTSSVVAPASRSSAAKPRKQVKLTATEVSLAKRLGLTVEQYAAEKMRSSNG
jgi:F0F1-type ATP synthase membrane subunit b/b'